jgi:hypothetical protein
MVSLLLLVSIHHSLFFLLMALGIALGEWTEFNLCVKIERYMYVTIVRFFFSVCIAMLICGTF